MKEITINTNALEDDITRLRENLKDLANLKKAMITDIETLNRMWKGKSNIAFNLQFQQDKVQFEQLEKALGEMVEAMENAKQQYDICDHKVNDLVNNIKV